jgi:putative tryptophan/tyrosine transport system substrate-binding protein
MIDRRKLLGTLAILPVACPLAVRAQQASKIHRVGLVLGVAPIPTMTGPDPIDPVVRAFVHGLRDLGYHEGKNVIIERRSAEGKFERFDEILAELVAGKVDIILAGGPPELLQAARRATSLLPIVMAAGYNPVETGIVPSLARPGGNMTGLTSHTGPEIEAKRLQMLKEAVPEASRIAFLGLKSVWESLDGASVRAAAQQLGVTLLHAEHTPTHYADAFAFIIHERPHGLFVARQGANFANRHRIADFAVAQRVPSISPYREIVAAGGLMSYGASNPDLFRRAAVYVDKILKGAKPADLPVEQPTIFELVINGRTAKALGLTIPPALLAFATEVIE